jgi:hypothetical protein
MGGAVSEAGHGEVGNCASLHSGYAEAVALLDPVLAGRATARIRGGLRKCDPLSKSPVRLLRSLLNLVYKSAGHVEWDPGDSKKWYEG